MLYLYKRTRAISPQSSKLEVVNLFYQKNPKQTKKHLNVFLKVELNDG